MVKPVKETKEDYYYKFPKSKFYIVRILSGKIYHMYPKKNLELPHGYSSRSAAEKHIKGSFVLNSLKTTVVTGTQASKFPVPKRS